MPMLIAPASHLDHDLSVALLAHVLALFADRNGFFIATIPIPSHLPALACDLYGPDMGDPPVDEQEARYGRRGARAGSSRLLRFVQPRPSRLLTVIAGPAGNLPCVLYTAHGGPSAPREPWEMRDLHGRGEVTAEELQESESFWSQHALAVPAGVRLDVKDEGFVYRYTAAELQKIWDAVDVSGSDKSPDEWAARQVDELLHYDVLPRWDEDGQPIYGARGALADTDRPAAIGNEIGGAL